MIITPLRRTFFLISILLATLCASAQQFDYKLIADNLQKKLSTRCSTVDSIASMANIMDIALIKPDIASPDSLARIIYNISIRSKDYETAYEMIMTRANLHIKNIDSLNMLLEQARQLPAEWHRDETAAFVQMYQNIYINSHASNPRKRSEELQRKLHALNEDTDDLYTKLALLHAVCLHLYTDTKSDLLVRYFDDLSQLSEELPITDFALRTFIARQSAMAYSLAERPYKSLEADRRMLTQIDSLTNKYRRVGRPYRTFSEPRYHIYLRMLSNYEKLHPEEIEQYHSEALRLAAEDLRAHESYMRTPSPDIFYAMAHKDYPTVVALLRDLKYTPENQHRKPQFLKFLITASQQTGDTDILLKASLEYNELLENMLASERHFSEPDAICETYMLRRRHNGSPIMAFRAEERMHHTLFIIFGTVILAMAVLLFLLIRYYRHSKTLSKTLSDSNEALRQERQSLQKSTEELTLARDAAQKANQFKTDFIRALSTEISNPLNAITEYSNLIVDCSDAERKPYLQQYARLVEHNAGFLNTVVTDIFHLSEIDSDSVTLHRSIVNIPKMMEICIETIRPRLKLGVDIKCAPGCEEIDTFTDASRLQQILLNLLDNAAKFTEKGSITLNCRLSKGNKNVIISVTDTGCGIPSEHRDMIFERLAKVNRSVQGVGLGLSISRLLAHLLGGDIMLDTTYSAGAKFMITIPYVVK